MNVATYFMMTIIMTVDCSKWLQLSNPQFTIVKELISSFFSELFENHLIAFVCSAWPQWICGICKFLAEMHRSLVLFRTPINIVVILAEKLFWVPRFIHFSEFVDESLIIIIIIIIIRIIVNETSWSCSLLCFHRGLPLVGQVKEGVSLGACPFGIHCHQWGDLESNFHRYLHQGNCRQFIVLFMPLPSLAPPTTAVNSVEIYYWFIDELYWMGFATVSTASFLCIVSTQFDFNLQDAQIINTQRNRNVMKNSKEEIFYF